MTTPGPIAESVTIRPRVTSFLRGLIPFTLAAVAVVTYTLATRSPEDDPRGLPAVLLAYAIGFTIIAVFLVVQWRGIRRNAVTVDAETIIIRTGEHTRTIRWSEVDAARLSVIEEQVTRGRPPPPTVALAIGTPDVLARRRGNGIVLGQGLRFARDADSALARFGGDRYTPLSDLKPSPATPRGVGRRPGAHRPNA